MQLLEQSTVNQPFCLPDVLLAAPLGHLRNDVDYVAAKSGDAEAAIRLALRVVSRSLLDHLRPVQNPLVLGIISIEASGINAIPQAAAAVIANQIGGELVDEIIQSTYSMRTNMSGIERIFSRPQFDGEVLPHRNYILVDDTLTQGATMAALSRHIHNAGGNVAALVALSGKAYSAKLEPDCATVQLLREKYGELENDFAAKTGICIDQLTHREARYLLNFTPAHFVRDCILAPTGKGA